MHAASHLIKGDAPAALQLMMFVERCVGPQLAIRREGGVEVKRDVPAGE